MSITARTDIYTDLNGLQSLKSSARKDARSALPEVARHFEAVMISMMIKGLRKTGMEDPYFKSQAMDSYKDMYDQQLAMELSKGRGIGLAKSIVEQMQSQASLVQDTPKEERKLIMPQRKFFMDPYRSIQKNNVSGMTPSEPLQQKQSEAIAKEPPAGIQVSGKFETPKDFVQKLWPLAEKTARKLGVSAEVLLSQAALATGWGKHIISSGQQNSYNLFNIKAGKNWQGKQMEKISMEYIHNRPIQQTSRFRAYDSYEQSFKDYADFILNSPRYKQAVSNNRNMEQSLHDSERSQNYIRSLHQAGYATDPQYTEKLMRVLNSEFFQAQNQKNIKNEST